MLLDTAHQGLKRTSHLAVIGGRAIKRRLGGRKLYSSKYQDETSLIGERFDTILEIQNHGNEDFFGVESSTFVVQDLQIPILFLRTRDYSETETP